MGIMKTDKKQRIRLQCVLLKTDLFTKKNLIKNYFEDNESLYRNIIQLHVLQLSDVINFQV